MKISILITLFSAVIPDRTCDDVRLLAEKKVEDIAQKIATLNRYKASLNVLIKQCGNNDVVGECPILDNLN